MIFSPRLVLLFSHVFFDTFYHRFLSITLTFHKSTFIRIHYITSYLTYTPQHFHHFCMLSEAEVMRMFMRFFSFVHNIRFYSYNYYLNGILDYNIYSNCDELVWKIVFPCNNRSRIHNITTLIQSIGAIKGDFGVAWVE